MLTFSMNSPCALMISLADRLLFESR